MPLTQPPRRDESLAAQQNQANGATIPRIGNEKITSDNGKFDRTEYPVADPPEQVPAPANAPADEFERM
jgi:hypothetical protein